MKPRNVVIDNVAIRRRIDGFHHTRLNTREREKAVRILHARGLNDNEIGTALGFSDALARKVRCGMNLSANQYGARRLVDA
jgi:hypothetical protein